MLDVNGKNVLVYGTGLSGISAVSFLLLKGANVFVYDDNVASHVQDAEVVTDFKKIKEYKLDFAVVSPGVQIIGNKNIEALNKLKVKVISEFALGFNFAKGKKICITGTNGKTTTVSLIKQILSKQFKEVFLCGNTETPITTIAPKTTNSSIIVCEVSSFAMETASNIVPDIACILNITPDHLTRHITEDNYAKEKLKLTALQKQNHYFVCNKDFKIKTKANIINYSLDDFGVNGAYANKNFVCINKKKVLDINKINLLGSKNLENILCAVTICKLLKVKTKNIKKAVYEFKSLPNRMELVGYVKRVLYVNDSKATNTDSTLCAINSFKRPIILLLGGSDKGCDFDIIFKNLPANVKAIVAFGETRTKLQDCAVKHQYTNITVTEKLYDAVYLCKEQAAFGDVVLLSPACASFDEFKSYAHRGEYFKKVVEEIKCST